MNADEFNARYPVGTPVLAYPGIRPEHPVAVAFQKRANDGRSFGDKDPCKRLVTRTRTPAWPLGHGEPVVSVDGYAGGIVLEHVDVISEEQFAKARAEETATAVASQGALPVQVGDLCGAREPEPRTGTSPCVLPVGHGGLKHQDKWTNQWPALPVPVGDQPQPLTELKQVAAEIARFGIYGAAVPATKALVKRADELVTENAELRARVAELEAERHTTNEALSDTAETLRANRDRIAELEKRSSTLAALEAAGVDNWDGYSDALDGDS